MALFICRKTIIQKTERKTVDKPGPSPQGKTLQEKEDQGRRNEGIEGGDQKKDQDKMISQKGDAENGRIQRPVKEVPKTLDMGGQVKIMIGESEERPEGKKGETDDIQTNETDRPEKSLLLRHVSCLLSKKGGADP